MPKYNVYYNFKSDLTKNMSVGESILCSIKAMTLGFKIGIHTGLDDGQATTLANGSNAVLNVSEKRAKKIVTSLIALNWCEKINVEKIGE